MNENLKSTKFWMGIIIIGVLIFLNFKSLLNDTIVQGLLGIYLVYCGGNIATKYAEKNQ